MVHVSDAVKHALKRVIIRTVVNDDVVNTVSLFRDIGQTNFGLHLEGENYKIYINQ